MRKYDQKGNLVYYKHSNGFEKWWEFGEKDNLVYFKNSDGYEEWYKWEDRERIEITKQEFELIKYRKIEKEFLSREEVDRFELMEI